MNDNALSLRPLLPVILGLSALGAVACAAPVAGPSEEPAPAAVESDDPTEDVAGEAATRISGSIGVRAPVDASDLDSTRATASTRLSVPSLMHSYEVVSWEFGVAAEAASPKSGTVDIAPAKPRFESLKVTIRPTPGTPSLMKHLFLGEVLDQVVLDRNETETDPKLPEKGKRLALATFDVAVVTSMSTRVEGGETLEDYEIAYGSLTMIRDGVSVPIGAAGSADHPCAGAKLGPYLQGPAGIALPKGVVPIDSAVVELSSQTLSSASGGASTTRASLDKLEIDAPLELGGLCAAYSIGRSALHTVRIDSASSTALATGKLVIDQTWQACLAFVTGTRFRGGSDGAMHETIALDAHGIVRTDHTKGGEATGWSFVSNAPIASCAEIVLR